MRARSTSMAGREKDSIRWQLFFFLRSTSAELRIGCFCPCCVFSFLPGGDNPIGSRRSANPAFGGSPGSVGGRDQGVLSILAPKPRAPKQKRRTKRVLVHPQRPWVASLYPESEDMRGWFNLCTLKWVVQQKAGARFWSMCSSASGAGGGF